MVSASLDAARSKSEPLFCLKGALRVERAAELPTQLFFYAFKDREVVCNFAGRTLHGAGRLSGD